MYSFLYIIYLINGIEIVFRGFNIAYDTTTILYIAIFRDVHI